MKCIVCSTDNNLKDRTANYGRCKSCNHPFAFEPTAMPVETKLTDPFFAKAIADLSANNTLFFTPRQLHYLLDKRLRTRPNMNSLARNPIGAIGCGAFIAFFFSLWTSGFFRQPVAVTAPIIFIIYGIWTIATLTSASMSPKLNRRIRHNSLKTLRVFALIILLIGLPVSIIANSAIGTIGSIGLSAIAGWLSWDRKRKQNRIFDEFLVDRDRFDSWIDRWNGINNPPEKILPRPFNNLPAAPNSEVTAYSFDRVVVCDRAEIAQLLIRNNFHFENNCAILTIDGYPQSIFETTLEMLSRNPDLHVYALHNCSPLGLQLIQRLRAEEIWFPNPDIPIIDVGILPRQIMDNIDVMTLQSAESARLASELDPELRANLTPAELEWLDGGCYLELESFSTQKLINILHRAIHQSHELSTIEGGDLIIIDNSPSFYTVESFG